MPDVTHAKKILTASPLEETHLKSNNLFLNEAIIIIIIKKELI